MSVRLHASNRGSQQHDKEKDMSWWREKLPELLSRFDVFTGKEGDVWETKVLVRREHSTGKQVRLAHVIEKAADVAIETSIDAV